MTDRLRLYAQWTSLDNPVAGQYRLVKEVSSFENSFGNRVIGVSSPFFFYYHRSTVAVHAGSLCFLASSKGPRLFEDFSKLSKQARKTNAISTFPYVPLFFLFPPFLFSLSLSLSLSLPLSRYFCFNFFSFFFSTIRRVQHTHFRENAKSEQLNSSGLCTRIPCYLYFATNR